MEQRVTGVVNVLDDLPGSGCAPPGVDASRVGNAVMVVRSEHRFTL